MFQKLLSFYKRNRLAIIVALGIVVVLQWCQLQANKTYREGESLIHRPTIEQSISQLDKPTIDVPSSNPWLPYLLMVGMVLLVFVAQRRGWIEKIFPRLIVLRIRLFKLNGRQMLRFFFLNTKKENQSFDAPVVEFMKPGKNKAYKIIVTDSHVSFPLTLTTSTAHSLVIDLDRFLEKVPELRKYHWVRVKIVANGVKEYRTWPRPIWSSFF
ncbi:MAG: hypothetical protein QM786_00880 [Breznakibacter sp.]